MSKFFLIPVPITEGGNDALPDSTVEKIHAIDIFLVERARTARRFLVSIKHPILIDDMQIFEIDKNDPSSDLGQFAELLGKNKTIGFMSEAGVPCVADPGNIYVRKAHELGVQVIPLVGPSSILLALMASGLNGQNFHFHGYFPVKEDALKRKLHSISNELSKTDKTHICIETPYRNKRLFEALIKHLPKHVFLSVAINIGSDNERILTKQISVWQKDGLEISKENAVFLIGK